MHKRAIVDSPRMAQSVASDPRNLKSRRSEMAEVPGATWFRRTAETATEYVAVGFVTLMMVVSTLRLLGLLG